MGMIKMTKKKIWNAGCVVLVLLLLCTVISFHVERLMRIPVEVVRGIQSEEEKAMQLARIPLSCYGEAPSTVFYVEEQEGLFGMELVAHTKEVWPIETAEDMALVPEQLDDDGLPLQIVRWSVYPLEDGDLVVVQEDGESRMLSGVNAEQLQELKKQLPGMAVCLFVLLAFMALGTWNLFHLQSRAYKRGLAGAVIVLACLGILWAGLWTLEIPREYLPPEHILDVKGYVNW